MEKKPTNYTTPVLVLLLIVASFLVGSMWNQIKELKGGKQNSPTANNQAAQVTPQPTGTVALGASQMDEVIKTALATRGDSKSKVTIVEFTDFECPFCKSYAEDTYPKIIQTYGDKIYYVFHDYPLPFHTHAAQMAEAAHCAGDQGKFWEMHDLLFAKRDEWSAKTDVNPSLNTYATQLGLNVNNFKTCLSSGKFTQAVKDSVTLGTKLGVSGTPSFFINGQLLVGAMPFDSFKTIIDTELNK